MAKEGTVSPFDYVKSIQKTKIDMIRDSDNPELAAKGYSPWMTNKTLSFYVDSILYANDMNIRHQLDNAMQYGYLINTVRGMNRKWFYLKKEAKDEDVALIQEHYNVNRTRATEILGILDAPGLEAIRRARSPGGTVKKK